MRREQRRGRLMTPCQGESGWGRGGKSRCDEEGYSGKEKAAPDIRGEMFKQLSYCPGQGGRGVVVLSAQIKPDLDAAGTNSLLVNCVLSGWKWLGTRLLLHPVGDILGCGAVVLIVVEELPLPERQQRQRWSLNHLAGDRKHFISIYGTVLIYRSRYSSKPLL